MTKQQTPSFNRAVVIGGGFAGLITARVLIDYFDQVSVIERDELPAKPALRRGLPQAHHAHLLLPEGWNLMEQWFPAITAELEAQGATLIDSEREMRRSSDGALFDDVTALACSRPLLDHTLYRRLADSPRITVVSGYEVARLAVDSRGRRVTGVHVRPPRGTGRRTTILPAEVVVDTSGRGSRAPQWLADLGYTPPAETTVDALAGYASRLYRRPADFDGSWKTMRVPRRQPDQPASGIIMPLEDERWHVTLTGISGSYPPGDPAGFLAYAQGLACPSFFEILQAAEPLSEVHTFRGTQNRLLHYDQLPRYLEGFLVSGDAVCAGNPIYTMGMTAATRSAPALAGALAETRQRGQLEGLAQSFQKQLRREINKIWLKITRSDRLWPGSEVVETGQPAKVRLNRPRSRTVILADYGLAAS
ncbi:MAG TPA: FAD-binding protein [Anaerolineae bacterium]|nr:FAD-binding protein [Anaerolineae bacterium]